MATTRVVVITGGASGIGRQTCLKFARKGDKVVVADYDETKGKETVELIEADGGVALFVKTDVSSYEDVEALIEKTVDQFGTIDVMFNNAGIGRPTPLPDFDLNDYHKVIDINQHGVAYGIMAAAKKMKELNIKGVIINTTSVFGVLASPATFAYHATKGAVNMMTKSAALDLAPYGIRVVGIAPGVVDTPIVQGYRDKGLIDGMKAKVIGNKLTDPEQLADAVYLLSLEEASAINGSVVMADEGYASFK
ncbi:SDR family NAD(P)-dependent oxidoreductase [Guptibacillus spartinae]|uniref:SDR family NAD(P)-dependent oxidoreductase n=1 Tax=Guptibacillus spartinae TaxID=3025679 RepID=UPI0023615FC9|nr:SDR family oxidoreductase [Pseudalkalibacillus spartinae]